MNRALFFILVLLVFINTCFAAEKELVDRVCAFVDNEAITWSELKKRYDKTKKYFPETTLYEVANTMVNRLLLMGEAKRLKITGDSEAEIIDKYINMTIRADIIVTPEEVNKFFNKHREEFKGDSFESVSKKIENAIMEEEVNIRLKETIKKLKENIYVKIIIEK